VNPVGHACPLRRCAPVPPRGSERLRSGRAALMLAPYGAARRSPQGGASAFGAAARRSCLPPTALRARPPKASQRLRSGRAALMLAPYGAARRSPRGGASAFGAAARRSCRHLGNERCELAAVDRGLLGFVPRIDFVRHGVGEALGERAPCLVIVEH